jgi:hypothetical protein
MREPVGERSWTISFMLFLKLVAIVPEKDRDIKKHSKKPSF